MNTAEGNTGAQTNYGLELFGDKWTFLIIRDMMFNDKQHPNAFPKPEKNMPADVVADRLQRLEADGIVTQQQDPAEGEEKKFVLTRKGIDLLPMLAEAILWTSRYYKETEVDRHFVRAIRKNRAQFLRRVRINLLREL